MGRLAKKAIMVPLGFLGLGMMIMADVLIPLWAHHLGYSPFQVGMVVGASALIPTLFSISAGSICDRLGTRSVLIVSAAGVILTSLLYPILTAPLLLFFLQLAGGFFRCFAWIGAQVHGSLAEDIKQRNLDLGYLSFGVNLASLVFPLLVGTLAGVDAYRTAFLLLSSSGAMLLLLACFLRPDSQSHPRTSTLGELLHPVADMMQAARVLKKPGVPFVMTGTFVRLMISAIRQSFYTIYLIHIGLNETIAGFMLFIVAAVGIAAAPAVMALSRNRSLEFLLTAVLLASSLAIITTPLFTSVFSLLPGAAAMGIGSGGSLPLLLALLIKYTTAEERGLAIGMRTSFNQLALMISPIIFGTLAEWMSLQNAFYLMGGILIMTTILSMRLSPMRQKTESLTLFK